MDDKKKIKICFIASSLSSGGMERVLSELAIYFSFQHYIQVSLITITKSNIFFDLPQSILIYQPSFKFSHYPRLISIVKTFYFIRKHLKEIKPNKVISFGGKYNSFVILTAAFLSIDIFISDRSIPGKSYGKFLDLLNPLLYKNTAGIIAQTEKAKEIISRKIKHNNVKIIGNPFRIKKISKAVRENIILNVGRFISSKQQDLLLDFFSGLKLDNWKLIFIGDGPELINVKKLSVRLRIQNKVEFLGLVKDIDAYYFKSKIFAFTSNSEGFPNVLGEAMAAGCACISFDCTTGPSELIDDGINGFLVPVGDNGQYIKKIKLLIDNEELRAKFGIAARKKIENKFIINKIAEQYLEFIGN